MDDNDNWFGFSSWDIFNTFVGKVIFYDQAKESGIIKSGPKEYVFERKFMIGIQGLLSASSITIPINSFVEFTLDQTGIPVRVKRLRIGPCD